MKTRIVTLLLLLVATLAAVAEIPAGYYDAAIGKSDEALKSAMHEIIAPHTRIDYGAKGTWVVFRKSDVREDGSIWDMYSNVVRYFPETGAHSEMHIEHSVPKSWWGEQSSFVYEASFDLHHLVPSDASTNMSKSNNILGEVVEATFDNKVSKIGATYIDGKKVSAFEPDDRYKGDFARMYMYVATCYQNYTWMSDGVYMFNTEAYPTLNKYAVDLLMRWHRQDPVSDKEINRNEAVYEAQSNRNPFIDFPMLAEYLWGDSIGVPFTAGGTDRPYLVSPAPNKVIDMGTAMCGVTLTYDMYVEGNNLTQPLQLSWKNNEGIQLSAQRIDVEDATAGVNVILSYNSTTREGVLCDTLIISGGGMSQEVIVPVELTTISSFVILPPEQLTSSQATLHWVEYPDADSYKVEVYQGASEATDLFISAYVEGSSYNKAIALHNGTKHTINLENYSIGIQHNGVGAIGDMWKLPAKQLAPNATYVLVNSQCDDATLKGMSNYSVPSVKDSPINFNGNDVVALYHNNILIDVVGQLNVVENWGQDVTLYRHPSTLGPSPTYDEREWIVAAKDDFTGVSRHTMQGLTSNPKLVLNETTRNNSIEVKNLRPLTTYQCRVTATCGAKEIAALYGCVFTTTELATPSGLYASHIYAESVKIQWDDVLDATGYEVNCFTMEGSGSQTVEEAFDDIESNGKPLPEGWSGTASGNYTSAASSGKSAPSVGLKKDGEYITTPTYDAPVTYMSFMYRFASKAEGSSLKVDCLKGGTWVNVETINYVNTTKTTRSYDFDSSDNVRAFRFLYNKVTGNMAIDDVVVTYGAYDTLYIVREEPVSKAEVSIYGLQAPRTYEIAVRAVKDGSYSQWSQPLQVTTDPTFTGVEETRISPITCVVNSHVITLGNLQEDSQVSIYNLQGALCHRVNNIGASLSVNVAPQSLYLITIAKAGEVERLKVIVP